MTSIDLQLEPSTAGKLMYFPGQLLKGKVDSDQEICQSLNAVVIFLGTVELKLKSAKDFRGMYLFKTEYLMDKRLRRLLKSKTGYFKKLFTLKTLSTV